MMEATQTEMLLSQAAEIAKRTFIDPTENAVLEIFRRLSYEMDCSEAERGERRVMH